MDHSQYIIDRLEEARAWRGMPIAELARRSGIDQKRLRYILKGERKLRADEFVRLIVVMGTPMSTYVPLEMLSQPNTTVMFCLNGISCILRDIQIFRDGN